jgi:N-acetylglucosaminyl-diphospho-decaprenol L-rhamnosyltransferase
MGLLSIARTEVTPVHVAVTIVGYRNVHDVVRCVASLSKSEYDDFEVVICENGGKLAYDMLYESLASPLPGGQKVRLIEAARNGGYAAGVNICLAEAADADAWWILNPDTEVSPTAMAALVARIRQGVHAVGGTLHFVDGRIQSCGGVWRSWLGRAVSLGKGLLLADIPDSAGIECKLDYLSGASMLIDRTFVQRVGFLAEDYFLYCEEIDWCLRGVRLGLKLGFAPDARVLHYQGTTTGSSSSLADRSWLSVYLDERNKMLITRRHFPAKLPVAAVAALILLGLRYLRRGAVRQFWYGISGWSAGMLGHSGPPVKQTAIKACPCPQKTVS